MIKELLEKQYENIPQELKGLRRWVCYNKADKIPRNGVTGSFAKTTDPTTWTKFNIALNGCIKYGFDGLGFVFGDGICGVDLDDTDWKKLKKGEITLEQYNQNHSSFTQITEEFINSLNSYTEKSMSGKGYHIICYGNIPEGKNRKDTANVGVEMYDKGRFFAFTGNVCNNLPVQERQEQINFLWEKYLKDEKKEQTKDMEIPTNENEIPDEELIAKILASPQGAKFQRLMDGDLSEYSDDHSYADLSLCQVLAFWTGNNPEQIDRIFRTSGLMRDKWDERRPGGTYGSKTIENAISRTFEIYEPQEEFKLDPNRMFKRIKKENIEPTPASMDSKFMGDDGTLGGYEASLNIDKNGEPIFKKKKIYKTYHLDDTGNAERFFDYYGDLFKYNTTDKIFMYWTGKTWIRDEKKIIRKYANNLLEVMRSEIPNIQKEISDLLSAGETARADLKKEYLKAFEKNLARLSNKAGKDAMLAELEALHTVPSMSSEYNTYIDLLNTDNGVVDLTTGKLLPYTSSDMLSQNTSTKVSFEEPKTWIAFLQSIFRREDPKETEELIEFIQLALGYTATGRTDEQVMFICYGDGSNGKSTFIETVSKILGEYSDNVDSTILMQSKGNYDSSAKYTIAKLKDTRLVTTSETDDGCFAERLIKNLTGSEKISAQFKYGNEFSFIPKFKIWLLTNYLPIIKGTDFGIWRRIITIPFLRCFTDVEKDKDMPRKLAAESPQILGWIIQGAVKYIKTRNLKVPSFVEAAKKEYKNKMDVVEKFIQTNCVIGENYYEDAKKIFDTYKEWAKDDQEYSSIRRSTFQEQMQKKGYQMVVRGGKPHFKGLQLKSNGRHYGYTGEE